MSEQNKSAFEQGKPLILSTDLSAAEEMDAVKQWVTRPNSEIANLEWRVVEAAVKLSGQMDCECFKAWADISTARAGCALLEAVDALIARRKEAENGNV